MGVLFEINQQIESILSSILDPETGELLEGCEDKFYLLETLTEKKKDIIEYLVRKCKDTDYLIESVESQIKDLQAHKDRLKKQKDGLIKVIDRECNGEKQDFGFAVVSYRKTSSVSVDDEDSVKAWCRSNGQEQCVTVKTTESINKTELKAVLKESDIPGAHIEYNNKCSVK